MRKYQVNDYVNGLLLSQARTVFYLGNDPSGFEEQLYIDLFLVSFSDQLILTRNLYRLSESINTSIYFTPDDDEWKWLPPIYGKTDESVPNFWFPNIKDCESIDVPNDGTSVRAKVTIDNVHLKWNKGSSSGSLDTAEIITVEYIK